MEVTIEITISEDEYKKWRDFEIGGVVGVKQQLKKDFREVCNSLGIDDAIIEVTDND